MSDSNLVFVLDAHLPFVRHPDVPGCVEETALFTSLSYTWLPLLRSCTSLETEGVPFKLGIAFSPTLCEMLSDPLLQERYIDTLDRTIGFGLSELDRCADMPEAREMIKLQLDLAQLNRRDFVEIYEKNVLKKFDYFANRGYIELLATTATSCYLPFYNDIPEAINAQIETGLLSFREHFTAVPTGFWLPAMGYSSGIEEVLKSYGFQYTLLESHGLMFSAPQADLGLFSPAWCRNNFAVLGRDKSACQEIAGEENSFSANSVYLDVDRDIGFELSEETLSPLFDVQLGRRITGFRYWPRSRDSSSSKWYQISKAHEQVCLDASAFLDRRAESLAKASSFLEGAPVSLVCALPSEMFGSEWYEGVSWLEQLFRAAAARQDVSFALPSSVIRSRVSEKKIDPYPSSWFPSGYAEEVLNSTNDWMYPYIQKATQRMIDLAERFPDDTGLKERALNMAARELLLAQTMDWYMLMNDSAKSDYARSRFEESVRAFTVVYESLGSNFISTEWLTNTEKKHNLFHSMNYRVFSRRK
mgnify:FL=1